MNQAGESPALRKEGKSVRGVRGDCQPTSCSQDTVFSYKQSSVINGRAYLYPCSALDWASYWDLIGTADGAGGASIRAPIEEADLEPGTKPGFSLPARCSQAFWSCTPSGKDFCGHIFQFMYFSYSQIIYVYDCAHRMCPGQAHPRG